MRIFCLFFNTLFFCLSQFSFSQETCTVATSGNWSGGSGKATWSCTGTATAPENPNVSTVIVPNGMTLTIKNNISWNADVFIQSGGTMVFDNQLNLGSAPVGCGFIFSIAEGGNIIDSGTGGNDRLYICGETILSSAPNPPSPAVDWPAGGFDGPTGFDENGENTILPVELLNFSARSEAEKIILLWSTASELNNDYFTLERSKNGKDFEKIAIVDGNGTSSETLNYKYIDVNPYLGISYYKLSQTDYDGTTEVFPVISELFKPGANNLSIIPNPINDIGFRLKSSGLEKQEPVKLKIIDLHGKSVEERRLVTDAFGNLDQQILLVKSLKTGTYIIELATQSNTQYQKIIVK